MIKPPATAPALSLPTEPNEPSERMGDYSWLIYGEKKIGKTSLVARFPDAFFMSTEPGTKALRVYSRPVTSWTEFKAYAKLLRTTKHQFQTVVVDTVDLLYKHCFAHVCKLAGCSHPQEMNDYGKTWDKIGDEFHAGVMSLFGIPDLGVVFLSHDTEKEIELRDGTKIDRVQPTMAKKAHAVIEAVVDVIVNYRYKGEKRFMRLVGAQDTVAGCRIEEHFVRKGGKPRTPGDRIMSIPGGESAQEAFDNLKKAFDNQQELADPEHYKPPKPTTPPKPAAPLGVKSFSIKK